MNNRTRIVIVTLLFGAMLLTARGRSEKRQNSDKLRIKVSILPQKYFGERIGGEHAKSNGSLRSKLLSKANMPSA